MALRWSFLFLVWFRKANSKCQSWSENLGNEPTVGVVSPIQDESLSPKKWTPNGQNPGRLTPVGMDEAVYWLVNHLGRDMSVSN